MSFACNHVFLECHRTHSKDIKDIRMTVFEFCEFHGRCNQADCIFRVTLSECVEEFCAIRNNLYFVKYKYTFRYVIDGKTLG